MRGSVSENRQGVGTIPGSEAWPIVKCSQCESGTQTERGISKVCHVCGGLGKKPSEKWANMLAYYSMYPSSVVIADGRIYIVAPDDRPGPKGHGGRQFRITRGGKMFTSCNLQNGEPIPQSLRHILKDNAKLEAA